jgi:hypothetical protein
MKNLFYISLLLFITVSSCKKEPVATATVVYQNDLVSDNQTWPVDSNAYMVRTFNQGHYSIRVDSPNRLVWALAPYASINFPYTVQVDGTSELDNVAQLGNVAVVFNLTSNTNFSVAEIWTNGTFRIWTRVNGATSTLVNFTTNSAIQTGSGSKNTIKLIQNQSTMELRVNNVSMGTFNISLPSSLIQTGPAVATAVSNFTPMAGLFNNFSISKNL